MNVQPLWVQLILSKQIYNYILKIKWIMIGKEEVAQWPNNCLINLKYEGSNPSTAGTYGNFLNTITKYNSDKNTMV